MSTLAPVRTTQTQVKLRILTLPLCPAAGGMSSRHEMRALQQAKRGGRQSGQISIGQSPECGQLGYGQREATRVLFTSAQSTAVVVDPVSW